MNDKITIATLQRLRKELEKTGYIPHEKCRMSSKPDIIDRTRKMSEELLKKLENL